MIGRQVILTKKAFTLEELNSFMQENWDAEEYNDFIIGKPTPASLEEYILLPATERFMVIIYSRKAGGLFSKDNKVILSVCDAPAGIIDRLKTAVHTRNAIFSAWQIGKTISQEKERKGPAEDALQKYTEYMKKLLSESGLLK